MRVTSLYVQYRLHVAECGRHTILIAHQFIIQLCYKTPQR
jgi:hypothetical protein